MSALKKTLTQPDFDLLGGGTIYILIPRSEQAKAWVIEHLQDRPLVLGSGICIESSYISNVMEGIFEAGMEIAQ